MHVVRSALLVDDGVAPSVSGRPFVEQAHLDQLSLSVDDGDATSDKHHDSAKVRHGCVELHV
jgi:hypothetical protein